LPRGAQQGIMVIEFGQMVSAPYCAKLFADLGADVIKVEPPSSEQQEAQHYCQREQPAAADEEQVIFCGNLQRRITRLASIVRHRAPASLKSQR
jgi:crotonobetainyl-CoA:carnitine CoA-transferase CaiB-like acyl-CoA transferase